MQAPYFLVRDDVAADVVARLGARDIVLWIRSPLEYGVSVDDLARFAGLPWAMVIDERYDKALVDAIQQAEAVDDPLVRRRGFIQVIESDIGKIELPPRSLPLLLLSGRKPASSSPSFDDQMRRMGMLAFIRSSSVRHILVIGGDTATIPQGILDICGDGFQPSLTVVSDHADAEHVLRPISERVRNLTLASSGTSQLLLQVLKRYGEIYPAERTMVRVRDRRGQFRVIDLTTGDEPERPVLEDYDFIEERDLRSVTPEELSDEAFNDFFSGASSRWEPYAAGLPWIRERESQAALRSILARADTQGSNANTVAFIASESGAGGTTLARTMAWELAREGYPVLMAKNLPFQISALPLVNYMTRARGLIGEGRLDQEAGSQSDRASTEHELYEVPWLIVFDVVHWQHRAAELVNFFHELRRSGRPACILVVTDAVVPMQFLNQSIFKRIAGLNHVIPADSAKQLGNHLNRYLKSRNLARNEQQWDTFFGRHSVGGLENRAAFWVTLSFWIRRQYDLTESLQEWIYSRFKIGCTTDDLKKAVLEIAALSAERIPVPEALLHESSGPWPMSALLGDATSDLGAVGLVAFNDSSGRHWALVHDVLGRYLLNALFYDFDARTSLGFGAAKSPEHLRLLILGQISRKVELGERRFRALGEDFATTFLKIDPDHGHFSFAPFWREALEILDQMPSPLRDASRAFRHHTAVSRRRIAKLGDAGDVGIEDRIELLNQAVADLRYAMEFIDYTEDSESDLNLLNSLANAYFDLASALVESGSPAEKADSARQLGYEAAARAYALSPANPFVVETHVKSLLERAGEGSHDAPALCVEALNVLFAASDSKEVQYRRDQLAKMADHALELLFQQPSSLDGAATRSGPVDVLVDAWRELASSFEDHSFFELDAIDAKAMDQALRILSDPVGAGNAQVLRLTFDLVIRKDPQSFATQLQLLEQLEVVGYRLPAQLLLERAVLLYQVGRATEGDREFFKLRALWKKSEQYVFVPERLRWLLTPDGRDRRAVDAITASGYGVRADARIQDFNKALTPYRPEEHGMKDPKPGRRFKTYISFGINGPFVRPMSAPRSHG